MAIVHIECTSPDSDAISLNIKDVRRGALQECKYTKHGTAQWCVFGQFCCTQVFYIYSTLQLLMNITEHGTCS